MAPEVIKRNNRELFYNEKCDIYSLGCVFYELLTKKTVHPKYYYLNLINQQDFKNYPTDLTYEYFKGIPKESNLRNVKFQFWKF